VTHLIEVPWRIIGIAYLSFHKRHLIHFLVIDRPVPEVPLLTDITLRDRP